MATMEKGIEEECVCPPIRLQYGMTHNKVWMGHDKGRKTTNDNSLPQLFLDRSE
jgi:hypothetical protein